MKTQVIAAMVLWSILGSVPTSHAARPWNSGLDFEATEKLLASAPITGLRSLKDVLTGELGQTWEGSSEPLLVTLAGGTRAVFRSEDEPWGSVAEVCGYRVARFLGSKLVPPTVPRVLRPGAGFPWPFPGKTDRPGSMQLFVPGKPTGDDLPADLSPKDASDIEILSFVMGRYDNHGGNLLRDATGTPVLIDFENSLEPQMWRLGRFSFARRGGEARSADGLPRSAPFPFDHPRTLVNPSLADIERTFGPWWGQIWPEGMKGLHARLAHHPRKTVAYVIWGDRLWVDCWASSRHPPDPKVFSKATLKRLEALDASVLTRHLLAPEYRPETITGIVERRDQILQAARRGPLVP